MDKILTDIGAFGRYQKLVLLIIGSMSSLNAMTIYVTIFTAAEPKLLCKYKNDTNSTTYLSNTCEIWSNITQETKQNKQSLYECKWDTQYYGLTIINEWNLICDRVYLASLTQTIFMIGALCSFFMGYISDKYGRQTVCLSMSLLMCCSIIISESLQMEFFNLGFSTKFFIYCVLQLLLGFTSYSLYVTSYVLLLEMTTSKYSTIVSNFNLYMYVVGELFALSLGYFARNWHTINWILSIYSIVIVLIVAFFLPESPRFLISNKQYKRAFDVLKKIAHVNGKTKALITEVELIGSKQDSKESKAELIEDNNTTEDTNDQTVLNYLTNPIFNLIKTLLLVYIWISLSMIYYGEGLGITQISYNFNPYFMCFLSSTSETIGYICCYLNDKFSRKKVLIAFLASASIMCLTVVLIPLGNQTNGISWSAILIIMFASIGKAMASAAFNSAYVFTSQLYPTNVRNTLVSVVSSSSRIGSLLAPQINMLRSLVWGPLPYLIFSGASLVSCVFTFFLPDTSSLNYKM